MSKFLKMTCITADNAHIAELINTIKTMISKQKQQITAFVKANLYAAVLWFEAAAAVTRSLSVCEVLMCLVREIIIRCFNATSENCVWSITWLVKKINKKKSQKMFKKIIKLNKIITCLIMNIVSSVQINMLIDKELFFQSKLKYCELYHENYHLMQCFKCQKYKHIIQICCQNQKYSLCAISKYDDYSCIFQNKSNKYCCINCEEFYLIWFFKCKTR